MAIPTDPDARLFYRAAEQRREDAAVLSDAGRHAGAVYLGGYVVECLLKALIVSTVRAADRPQVVASFRGAHAHSYDWLLARYRQAGGPMLSVPITLAVRTVDQWTVSLRYDPSSVPADDAAAFAQAVDDVRAWANGRL